MQGRHHCCTVVFACQSALIPLVLEYLFDRKLFRKDIRWEYFCPTTSSRFVPCGWLFFLLLKCNRVNKWCFVVSKYDFQTRKRKTKTCKTDVDSFIWVQKCICQLIYGNTYTVNVILTHKISIFLLEWHICHLISINGIKNSRTLVLIRMRQT